jgi:hypothetical protein
MIPIQQNRTSHPTLPIANAYTTPKLPSHPITNPLLALTNILETTTREHPPPSILFTLHIPSPNASSKHLSPQIKLKQHLAVLTSRRQNSLNIR